MAEMGRYCKAYLASDLQKYPSWNPSVENLRQPEAEKPDAAPERRTELADDDILYLQESLVVTDGIFKDENIVFSDDSQEWQTFCTDTLQFEVPEDVMAIGAEEEAAAAAEAESEADDEGDGEG